MKKTSLFINFHILLLIIVLGGCSEKNDSSLSDEKFFEVIDSDIWAQAHDIGEIAWFDDETVIFIGRSTQQNEKGFYYNAILAWNIKTGRLSRLIDKTLGSFCLDGSTLIHYFSRSEKRQFDVVQSDGEIILEDKVVLPGNLKGRGASPHCTLFKAEPIDYEYVADLKKFDALLSKVWLEGRELTEIEKRGQTTRFETRFFSKDFPEGKSLGFKERAKPKVQWSEYEGRYFLRVGERLSGRSIEKDNTSDKSEYDYFFLSKDGSLEQVPVPEGWDRAYSIYPTAKGVVIDYVDMRKKNPKAGESGLYLIDPICRKKAVELLHGYANAVSVSPDGCRLATAHFPEIVPMGPYDSTLKIINLCGKESE